MSTVVTLLKKLGFTEHESKLYLALYQQNALTGYEAAKFAGIPRSNAYTSLSTLVEKGGAVRIEGEPLRFQSIPFNELSDNITRQSQCIISSIESLLPDSPITNEPFITLNGDKNIMNKIIYLINQAKRTIYIDGWAEEILVLKPHLIKISQNGLKVVVISVGFIDMEGIWSYEHKRDNEWLKNGARPIRIITDTHHVLIGEIGNDDASRGLYSTNKNLINLVKESFIHDILLVEITNRFETELAEVFGQNLQILRKKISSNHRDTT